MRYTVTAFYKFVSIEDPASFRPQVLDVCRANSIVGTVLLANEGINGTVAGPEAGVAVFLAWLRADPRFCDLVSKESYALEQPFARLKVRLKREIVTLGRPEADPNMQVGTYVKPQDWNALISQEDVVLLDTRNAYEVKIGTFEGAQDPGTRTFRQFPDYVRDNLDPARHKRVAMFCTGGIRCEKASAYMLTQGFEEVYHLEGGILKYLETVAPGESLWRGECFVFDERVALGHGVELGTHVMCPACGGPTVKDDTAPKNAQGAQLCSQCASRLDAVQKEVGTPS
ncbi:MAG: rhodanese-related sulfurtransferase [Hyphomicrobiaceae bacterium]